MTNQSCYDNTPDRQDSFLYSYDEVPFDEIPPEPGRRITDEGYGGLTIQVKQECGNDNNYDNSQHSHSPPNTIEITARNDPLERTIVPNRMTRKTNRRPLSERLGPPVKKPIILPSAKIPIKKQPTFYRESPSCSTSGHSAYSSQCSRSKYADGFIPLNSKHSSTLLSAGTHNSTTTTSYSATRIIPRPTRASVLRLNKNAKCITEGRLGPPVRSQGRGPRRSSISAPTKTGGVIQRVKSNNPISKAKGKSTSQKTDLTKNISSLTKSFAKYDNSNNAGAVIADLIQGILEEPEVKEIISSIAEQTVTTHAMDELPFYGIHQGSLYPGPPFVEGNILEQADRIIEQANKVCNGVVQSLQSKSQPNRSRAGRVVPPVKVGNVKLALYCKACKLEFPTQMLKDCHNTTDIHRFATQEWWNCNPKPPVSIPANKFPLTIFCIACWDRISPDTEQHLLLHLNCKRHKRNRNMFSRSFGKAPLYDWCFWDSLSDSFRSTFVPVAPKMRLSVFPEYVYEQRTVPQ